MTSPSLLSNSQFLNHKNPILFTKSPFHPACSCTSASSLIQTARKRVFRSSITASLELITTIVEDPSIASSSNGSATSSLYADEENEAMAKVGARVRVKVPLKVYHISKVPDLDLNGLEGELKQYVGVWKGKRISANLPFKVQFVENIEGRDGPVKFFAHLKEDEFGYID